MKKKKVNNKKKIYKKRKINTNLKVNNKKKKKKIKVKFGRILLVLLIIFLIFYLLKCLCKFPIKNIYISGNINISDQEIIDLAKIENYPSIFKYSKNDLKKNIESSDFIKKAIVKKKKLKEIYIEVEENTVLFYNSSTNKTILSNKKEIDNELNGPILINYVPNKVYEKLLDKMVLVDYEIINRISEIKYDPSNVDEERFLFTMTDGNYVYITLEKLENINNYIKISLEIIKKFGNKNGILNLDAGEYFEIFDD